MMPRTRRDHRIVLAVSIGLAWLSTAPIVARAHEAHPYHGDAPVTIGVVLATSVVAGFVIGATVVAAGTRSWRRVSSVLDRLFGPFLVVLGLTYAAPAVQESVVPSAIGGLGGGVGVWILSTRYGGGNHATGIVVVLAHRIVEGVVLAAGYVAGSTVGLVGSLLIAGHAAIESASVGGLAAGAGRFRAMVAVAIVQAGFVIGAIAGTATVIALPGAFRVLLLAVEAGALCVIGVVESIGRHRSGAARPDRPTR